MTAQVAIINREVVALASDSAVTLTAGDDEEKVYPSANKLFQLSRTQPVAVMLYDSATINDVPWETIIKLYREQLASRSFPTLDEYVSDFLAYLATQAPRLFATDIEDELFSTWVHTYLHVIKFDIDGQVDAIIQASGSASRQEIEDVVEFVIEKHHRRIMAAPVTEAVPTGYLRTLRIRYGTEVDEQIGDVLTGHTIVKTNRRRLRQLLFNLFLRGVVIRIEDGRRLPPVMTGLVFAGFGTDDFYPRLREHVLESYVAGHIKRYAGNSVSIDPAGVRATVVPFAQEDMVVRFMEGVDREYEEVVETMMEQVLNDYPGVLLAGLPRLPARTRDALLARAALATPATMQTIREFLARVREDAFWGPVAQLVDLLPKEEVAAMAEALVNLTSFKRRISWDAETVGGPVDVAVISRGDGFIWIKRKHYFRAELNPGFIVTRYGGQP